MIHHTIARSLARHVTIVHNRAAFYKGYASYVRWAAFYHTRSGVTVLARCRLVPLDGALWRDRGTLPAHTAS